MTTTRSPSRTRHRGAALGALLGVAMGAANLLGYVMVLLLSRTLGPADFGGYTALSTYGVILAIPAGAFQVIVARRLSGDPAERTTALSPALWSGAALLGVTVSVSPWLARSFHLPSPVSAVLLGGMLVPMLATGCFQGVLLGTSRLRSLSLLYLVTAATRLLAAAAAAWRGWGVTQVFGAMLAAAVLTALTGAWMCRDPLRALPAHRPGVLREAVRSNSTLAAYIVLTNIDVLLARHFLTPFDSGGYALASTFGRAMGWGTQFIALLVVPRMHRRGAARTTLKAGGLVLGIGLVGLGVVATAPSMWITLAGGSQFRGYGRLALACVVLGIGWALAQVWLFSEMGSNHGRLGLLTWGVIAAEVAAITLVWHHDPGQIVGVCTAGAVVIAATGLLRAARPGRRPGVAGGSAVIAADGPRVG